MVNIKAGVDTFLKGCLRYTHPEEINVVCTLYRKGLQSVHPRAWFVHMFYHVCRVFVFVSRWWNSLLKCMRLFVIASVCVCLLPLWQPVQSGLVQVSASPLPVSASPLPVSASPLPVSASPLPMAARPCGFPSAAILLNTLHMWVCVCACVRLCKRQYMCGGMHCKGAIKFMHVWDRKSTRLNSSHL